MRFELGATKKARGREEKYVPNLDCYIHDVYYLLRTLNIFPYALLWNIQRSSFFFNEKFALELGSRKEYINFINLIYKAHIVDCSPKIGDFEIFKEM